MLGPLPPLYRYAVCAAAFLGCAGVGAWLGLAFLPLPSAGAGLGAALGVVVVALLLHDHTEPGEARVRHRLRHH
jgi:hypothetical protein